jgi:hypothetical protein
MKDLHTHHLDWLKKELNKYSIKKNTLEELMFLCTKL